MEESKRGQKDWRMCKEANAAVARRVLKGALRGDTPRPLKQGEKEEE